jgi:hypothetical protein
VGLLLKRQKLNWSELLPKRQNLNWSGITLQQAKIKLEWYYSPKGKTLNWSGNIPKRLKLNWSGPVEVLPFGE